MDEEDQKYSVASKATYAMYGKEPRADRIIKTQAVFDQHIPNSGYVVDPTLSNARRAVFKNDDTKDVIISHRGTQVSKNDLKDVKADINLFFGKHENMKRFQKAVDRDKKDIEKFKKDGYSVKLTGHSLGSVTAMMSSRANNTKSVVFNAGGSAVGDTGFIIGSGFGGIPGGILGSLIMPSSFQIKNSIGLLSKVEKRDKKNIKHYYVRSDPISLTSRKVPGKHKVVPRRIGLDSHTIENFIFV